MSGPKVAASAVAHVAAVLYHQLLLKQVRPDILKNLYMHQSLQAILHTPLIKKCKEVLKQVD
jgi:glucose-6-phosphate-specific signal transduction histidine kinase